MNKEKLMQKIVEEIRTCKKCKLYQSRTNTVPGEGDLNTKIMFIGEAPGAREDATGRPFVGAAGKLLTQLIETMGIKRDDVYITNIVKCRPPGNRDPQPDEIYSCLPYLKRQINIIYPKIIVTLGRHATKTIFEIAGITFRSMSNIHGNEFKGKIDGKHITIVPTYHPAAALYNPNLRQILFNDFKVIKELANKGYKGPLDYFIQKGDR